MNKTILIASSEPTDLIPLRVGNERKVIKAANNHIDNQVFFDVKDLDSVTFDDLSCALQQHQPRIFHFVGHGEGEEGLCIQDDDNKKILIDNAILESLFKNQNSHTELVILNACYSSSQAKYLAQYIPYVIGMDKKILDKTAIKFSESFYKHLCAGADITTAYQNAKLSIKASKLYGHDIITLYTKESLPTPAPTLLDPILLIPPSSQNRKLLTDKHFIEVHDTIEASWGFGSPRRITNKTSLRHELSMVETNFIYIYARVTEETGEVKLQLGSNGDNTLSFDELGEYLEEAREQKPIIFLVLFGKISSDLRSIIPESLQERSRFLWLLHLPNQRGGLEELSRLTCQVIEAIAKQPNLTEVIKQIGELTFRISSETFGDPHTCLDVSSNLEKQFRAALLRLALGRGEIKSLVSESVRKHMDYSQKLLIYATTGNQNACVFELPQQIKYHAQPSIQGEGVYIKNIPIHVHLEPELDVDDIFELFDHALTQSLPYRSMSISAAIPHILAQQQINQNNSALAFNWNISIEDDVDIEAIQACLTLWIEQLNNVCNQVLEERVCILQSFLIQAPETIDIKELHEVLQDTLDEQTMGHKTLETLPIDQPLNVLRPREINRFFNQSEHSAWKQYFEFDKQGIEQGSFIKWVCQTTAGEFEHVVSTLWKNRQSNYQPFKNEHNA